jgi:glycosyltransferase involved in cell wall biosynthesis
LVNISNPYLKVVVNCRFLTQPMTGVQQYALKLSNYLKEKMGDDAEFVSPEGILHNKLAEKLNVKIIGNTKGFFWEQVELPFWLRKEKSPLLVNFGNVAPQYYSNQIVTIHDLSTLEHPEWYSSKFSRAYKFMIPQVVKNAKMVIAVSNFTKRRIVELLETDPAKIEVIYNTVEKDPLNIDVDNHHPYFLSVGSFSGRKNFTTLIKAFKQANLEGVKLKIRGDHEDIFKGSGELKDLAADHERIQFIEPLNYDAYLELIRNSIALINTSVYEGFGMPNLEALSLGVPVICSNIEVFKEVSGNCATFIDPLDESSLTRALKESMHGSPGLNEKKARIKQAEKFNISTEGEKLINLISRTI